MSCIVIENPVIEIVRPQHDVNLSREVGREVNIVPTGAPGPIGPQGTAGTAPRFEHQQTTPSATWIVNHNLSFRPNVSTLTLGGVQMIGEHIHISTNQVNLYFDSPVAGIAIFS